MHHPKNPFFHRIRRKKSRPCWLLFLFPFGAVFLISMSLSKDKAPPHSSLAACPEEDTGMFSQPAAVGFGSSAAEAFFTGAESFPPVSAQSAAVSSSAAASMSAAGSVFPADSSAGYSSAGTLSVFSPAGEQTPGFPPPSPSCLPAEIPVQTEKTVHTVPGPEESSPLTITVPETGHVHDWQPVYETILHEAVIRIIPHEAETETIRHQAQTHTEHHEAVTHTIRHEAQTHVVRYEEEGHFERYERHSFCSLCGLDLDIEYQEGRLEDIGLHSLLIHEGMAGWYGAWVKVDRFFPGSPESSRRQEWIVDTPAREETVVDREAWDEIITDQEAWDETVVDREAYEETIVRKAAWEESVVEQEAFRESILVRYRCPECGAEREP